MTSEQTAALEGLVKDLEIVSELSQTDQLTKAKAFRDRLYAAIEEAYASTEDFALYMAQNSTNDEKASDSEEDYMEASIAMFVAANEVKRALNCMVKELEANV